jgi:hypothetical protein
MTLYFESFRDCARCVGQFHSSPKLLPLRLIPWRVIGKGILEAGMDDYIHQQTGEDGRTGQHIETVSVLLNKRIEKSC